MSLYDIVVGDGGQRDRGRLLLAVLGDPFVARFRDAWVEKGADGEPVIAIYTRQGGGNRDCYCGEEPWYADREHVPAQCYAACNEALQAHPLYLRDADGDFDRTYATFYFRCPEGAGEALRAVAADPVNMSEAWQAAIERIRTGALRPAEVALGDQVGAFLADPGAAGSVMEV